jgi:hypothetical protein
VEKSLPVFDGSGNVYDFIVKMEAKLLQYNITGEHARNQLLKSKLTGVAFTAVRLNPMSCTTFADTAEFLRVTYAPSVAGVKASLTALAFRPTEETVREFNAKFNLISGAAPTSSIT